MDGFINYLEVFSEKLYPVLQKHFLSGSGGIGGIVYGLNSKVILLDITLPGLTDAIILAAVGSLIGIIVGEIYKGLKKLFKSLWKSLVNKLRR